MTNDFNAGYLVGMQRGRIIEEDYTSSVYYEKELLQRDYCRLLDQKEQLENFIREILNVYCIGTCECHEDNVDCKYKNSAGFGCFIWDKAEELGVDVN